MAYDAQQKLIRFGQFGLMSDIASDNIPDGALIRCENAQFLNGIIEKADEITDWVYGNPDYTTPSFTGEKPVGNHRYFPFPKMERQCVVTDSGNVYKYTSPFFRVPVTPESGSPATLSLSGNPVIVSGGNEVQGNSKKVFIFTGNSQVQVIEGDGTTRRNIANPAADWSTSYPTYGLIFRGKLVAFGNISNPHGIYFSSTTDQEDFRATTVGVLAMQVFPGEGEGIISAFVYKTKLFVFKKPYGVYVLNDTDVDPTNWFFQKTSGSFGIASPLSFFEATDDMYILSNDATIISMSAALRIGDVYNADLLSGTKTATYFRSIVRNQYLGKSFACYLPKKKIGVFAFPSYKSKDGYCDSLIYVDFNGDIPRLSWHRYKDSEFTSCHYFKDSYGDDQFLFSKLNFNGSTYQDGVMATYFPAHSTDTPFRIQTPNSNLGVEGNKNFDGFELLYESTNNYPLAVDVYVDSKFSETFLVQPFYGQVLGPVIFAPGGKFANPVFTLGSGYTAGRGTRPKWNSLHARGQTISFVIRDGNTIDPPYTGAPNADDDSGSIEPKKITGVRVYYSIAGQDQKSQSK